MEKLQTDIAIIGAGTAGMSAAIYALRAGKNVKIFEQKALGGQIVNASQIENYPGIEHIDGFEFTMKLYEQVKNFGGDVLYERVLELKDKGTYKEIVTDKNIYEARSVIIASGTQKAKLGLDNERALTGKGVSYCATCDGAFYRGKITAVVGGASTALEDGIFLSGYCKKVYMIHRRGDFAGEEKLVSDLLSKENVETIMNSEIVSLNGDDALKSITVHHRDSGQDEELNVDGLFIAIGQNPQNMDFADIVRLDEKGYIIAGEDCKTTKSGIYAAGDCRTKRVRQLTTAAADGAVAALEACMYIRGKV